MDVGALGVVVVGLVLCFAGSRSLHVAVLASGFALGWLLADAFGATLFVAVLVAAGAAFAAWLLARVVFGFAVFAVGGIAGAIVGARVFALLQHDQGSVVLAVLFVAATAFIGGLATRRFQGTLLAAVCALGGAALVTGGLGRAFPQALGFLRSPDSPGWALAGAAIWVGLAALGWSVQRRAAAERDATDRQRAA